MTTPHRRGERRVTAELSEKTYAALTAAKLFYRRPLKTLLVEGVEAVIARYRADRAAASAHAQTTPAQASDTKET